MELETVLLKIYESAEIPLLYLKDGNPVRLFDSAPFSPNPSAPIVTAAADQTGTAFYTCSPEFVYSGLVRSPSGREAVVIGPVLPSACTKKQALNILKALKQPSGRLDEIYTWLSCIPPCSRRRFNGLIGLLSLALGGNPEPDILSLPYHSSAPHPPLVDTEPSYIDHFAAPYRKEILANIKSGSVGELETLVGIFPKVPEREYQLDYDAVRSLKNIFILSLGLASAAALDGGLEPDLVTSVSDRYLSRIESLYQFSDIVLYLKQMFLDFGRRVADLNALPAGSPLAAQVRRDVQSHIAEKITVSSIAERLGKNSSYLCTHFKQTTGKTLSEYINEMKVREGMRLLKSTDLPLLEISVRLGFSSQNYFHTVFRKIAGMTPNEYRNQ